MTWDYVTDITTRDIRDVVDKYIKMNARPEGLSDQDYALHILADLFVLPVIAWHKELAARAEQAKAEAVKENAE